MRNMKRNLVISLLKTPLILALGVVWIPPQAQALEKLQCSTIVHLMQAIARNHISINRLDKLLVGRVSKQLVKRLDPSKNLLLDNDATKIRGIVSRFLQKKRTPNCTELLTIPSILRKRSKGQLAYARKQLTEKYKFNENVTFVTSSKKRKRSKSVSQSHKRLMKHLHFQISNYLLNDMKMPEARKKLVHRYELNLKRVSEFDESDLYDSILNAFANSLDPHSTYLNKEFYEDFQIAMRLSLEGIGASLTSEDGYTVIQELIPGGSAEKSKMLESKDKILSVGQEKSGLMEDVVDMDLRDVVKLIRGKSGSAVRLGILRQGKEASSFTVTLIRSKVVLQDDAAKVTFLDVKTKSGKKFKLAHLVLPSFYGDPELKKRSSYRDMEKAIEKVNKENADGLLLDFARNGGGRLEEAVKIAGLFIKEGNIVATKDTRRQVQKLFDDNPAVQFKGPMVILTSRLSASASEIVAGALKDYHRAVIVGGDYTYGKGSVQAILPLRSIMSAIKITTGLFFIPGGKSTQHTGVLADIRVPSLLSTDDLGEKHLDYSLPPQSITPFLSPETNGVSASTPSGLLWQPVTKAEIRVLKIKSKKRVAKSKKFKEIIDELKEVENNDGIVYLAKLRKESKERKKKKDKDKKKKSAKERLKEIDAPQVAEAMNVLRDLVEIRHNSRKNMAQKGSNPS